MHELVLNEDHGSRILQDLIPSAKRFVWIATADLKDLHVPGTGRRYIPFISVLAELVQRGVDLRLIHAKEPGPRFRKDFDRCPDLIRSERFERILCPRMHMKVIIVDARLAYLGSANMTGAGIGTKSAKRRNFEAGILTDDASIIQSLMAQLDDLYLGNHCPGCGRRDVCPDPIR